MQLLNTQIFNVGDPIVANEPAWQGGSSPWRLGHGRPYEIVSRWEGNEYDIVTIVDLTGSAPGETSVLTIGRRESRLWRRPTRYEIDMLHLHLGEERYTKAQTGLATIKMRLLPDIVRASVPYGFGHHSLMLSELGDASDPTSVHSDWIIHTGTTILLRSSVEEHAHATFERIAWSTNEGLASLFALGDESRWDLTKDLVEYAPSAWGPRSEAYPRLAAQGTKSGTELFGRLD